VTAVRFLGPDTDAYVASVERHAGEFEELTGIDLDVRIIGSDEYFSNRIHHLLDGEGDVEKVMREVGQELNRQQVDVAFVGIGENGHLAFNDPPADFETEQPYILVQLDEVCRRQQLGEGWFPTFDDVPKTAISMSIRQILKAREILCAVPEIRKAPAVQRCFEGEVSPQAPASILRTHPNTTVYLDKAAASQLKKSCCCKECC
jgi:glucosamine-6-phosphate deaminase